jgi:hypothetical protein
VLAVPRPVVSRLDELVDGPVLPDDAAAVGQFVPDDRGPVVRPPDEPVRVDRQVAGDVVGHAGLLEVVGEQRGLRVGRSVVAVAVVAREAVEAAREPGLEGDGAGADGAQERSSAAPDRAAALSCGSSIGHGDRSRSHGTPI